MNTTTTRQITLRLPEPLYQTVKELAKQRRMSVNQLTQESIAKLAQEEFAAQMRRAYEELGQSPEETDVEEFFYAQREAICDD